MIIAMEDIEKVVVIIDIEDWRKWSLWDFWGSREAGGLSAVEADVCGAALEKVFYPSDDRRRDPLHPEIVDESFVVNIIKRSSDVHEHG